jgi:serine/threonine protein kinase
MRSTAAGPVRRSRFLHPHACFNASQRVPTPSSPPLTPLRTPPPTLHAPQAITKNTAHPFCIRQYASFQDKYHLYFLFDLMPGGDLMDVLVAEARVIKHRVPTSPWQVRLRRALTSLPEGPRPLCHGRRAGSCVVD